MSARNSAPTGIAISSRSPSTIRHVLASAASSIPLRICLALARLVSSVSTNCATLVALGCLNWGTGNGEFCDISAIAPGTIATCSPN